MHKDSIWQNSTLFHDENTQQNKNTRKPLQDIKDDTWKDHSLYYTQCCKPESFFSKIRTKATTPNHSPILFSIMLNILARVNKKWKERIKDNTEKENKNYFSDNIIRYITSSTRIGQSINLAHEKWLLIVHLIKLGVKAELHVANIALSLSKWN